MPRSCHVLRVFTRGDAGGNHLGVVEDLAGLDTHAMQGIAARLGFSETTFVEAQGDGVPNVRIFTPNMELPFAGHPLVGTAWVLNVLGGGAHPTLRCGVGDVGVSVAGNTVWVDAALGQPVTNAASLALADRAGLDAPSRSWLVEMPKRYVVLEYADEASVTGAKPDFDVLSEVFGTLVFSRTEDAVRARFFAPDAGVPEDPATGSAAVALAAALVSAGESSGALSIDQGEETGFPSRIELEWTEESARIGGTVVRDEMRALDI
ncbi:MAG: PhzF family phenazine biosynthesis protein [Acidimicrobiia bacterium]